MSTVFQVRASDIIDTSLALLLKESAEVIMADIEALLAVLKKKAFEPIPVFLRGNR